MKVSSADNRKKRYRLAHPEKYMGNPANVIIRSSWEAKAFAFCDNNPNILRWSSEEIAIPYAKPVANGFKPSKYYPDLYVEYIDRNGILIKELVEVKPLKQTRPSRARNPQTRMYENYVHIVNTAKWEAALAWCNQRGVKFSIITEKSLFR